MKDPLLSNFRRDTFATRTPLLVLIFCAFIIVLFHFPRSFNEDEIASRSGCDGFVCEKRCTIYNRPKANKRRLLVSRSTQKELLAAAWRKCTECCSTIYEAVPRVESPIHPDYDGYIPAPVSAPPATTDKSKSRSSSMSYVTAQGSTSTSYHSALEEATERSRTDSSTPFTSGAGPSTTQNKQSVVETPKDAPAVSRGESGSSAQFQPGSPYSPAPQNSQTQDSPRNYSPMGLTRPLSFTVKIRAQVFGPRPGTWKWQMQVNADTTFDTIMRKGRKLMTITEDTALDVYDIYGHKTRVKYKDVEHRQIVNVVKLPARIELQHIVT